MVHVSIAHVARVVTLGALLGGTVASAQGPIRGTPIRSTPIQVEREVLKPLEDSVGSFSPLRGNVRGATVYGTIQNHLGELVPLAGIVRIRSLIDGKIIGEVKVDNLAQFTLRGFEPGLYAAELMDPAGGILATSGAFSAGVGEVIQLAPVIPMSPTSGLASLLGNATSSAVSTAASAGILGVAPGEPASPPR